MRVLLRNDESENWKANNPVLYKGEIGITWFKDDIPRIKIGDGKSNWKDLKYLGGEGSNTELLYRVQKMEEELNTLKEFICELGLDVMLGGSCGK